MLILLQTDMIRLLHCTAAALAGRALTVAVLICAVAPTLTFADRVLLTDGTIIEVDAAWEDTYGVWYRRSGVTQMIDRLRVRSIEHSAPPDKAPDKALDKAPDKAPGTTDAVKEKPAAATPAAATPAEKKEIEVAVTVVPSRSVWIHLKGGARIEVDEATETADGVWYRRGAVSVLLERARVERIEHQQEAAATAAVSGNSGSDWQARGWSTGSTHLDKLIRANGTRYNVDPFLIFCVMEQESHFRSRAVSAKGARGLMQLMPATARRFGVERIHDPAQNIAGGTRYLKELLVRFNGRVDLVLASYNAGEGAVMRYGHKIPPYRETRNYVRRIGARYGQSRASEMEAATTTTATTVVARPLQQP